MAEKFRNMDPSIADTYEMAFNTAMYHTYIPTSSTRPSRLRANTAPR